MKRFTIYDGVENYKTMINYMGYEKMSRIELETTYIKILQERYDNKVLTWTGVNKVEISIYKMDKSYLMNCIELLHRRNPDRISKKWIELLLKELSNRGNSWWS